MKNEKSKTRIVYSLALCNHLKSLGFKCLGTSINFKDVSKVVFIFEKNDELDAVIDEYIKSRK